MSTEPLKHATFHGGDGRSFASPQSVVDDTGLDHDGKRSILEEWKRRVAAENREDGIDTLDHTLDRAIENLAGLRT
ncbi:hypothetical protein [Aureimonas pseudogalii]|uniref:Uncharacterized protein n=1 Tax=Aureimonas pseudogalii TaxID=1744844 RepID=A0A7W6EEY5_9HYPH|nr:hypothetical protein [Aureimonas pseudogalii]MBB3996614.1 hypothetical protein [Aureimonas pseudogalii]